MKTGSTLVSNSQTDRQLSSGQGRLLSSYQTGKRSQWRQQIAVDVVAFRRRDGTVQLQCDRVERILPYAVYERLDELQIEPMVNQATKRRLYRNRRDPDLLGIDWPADESPEPTGRPRANTKER